MKRNKIALMGIALVSAGTLALAGCAANGGGTGATTDPSTAPEGGSGDAAAIIKTNGSEPENPLLPANTNETGGGKIIDAIYAGLVSYAADGTPENDMAENIETIDAQNLKVTLKQGQKFTDGEEVTADNFINAWNYGANLANAQKNQSWFADIEGYSDTENVEKLSGLVQVDDYTFTIKLNKPASDFALRLGYSSYYPLPDVAFEDIKAFGESPIGNGPYKLAAEDAWEHKVGIDLVKNEDYQGERAAKNGGLRIVFYALQDAAYADLEGGNVDVIDVIPANALKTFQDTLGDRAVNQPAAVFQSFTIPERLEHWSGEEGQLRRQALSMAINRDEITQVIFNGTRTPATDFSSPVIGGYSDKLKGAEVLQYDPEKAAELWAQADKIKPWSGKFEIAYNSDGGHDVWVDAVVNSIKNTLKIEAAGAPYPTFAELRAKVSDESITTAFRTGWQADYPGLYNFLAPLYMTNASSNDGKYSNPEFDALLNSGIGASDVETGTADFQKAEEILFQDLPAIPLWYSNVTGAYAEGVDNVTFGWNSVPMYTEITKE